MKHDDEARYERESLGGKPTTPEDENLRDRCESDRESLTPKESADCAGAEIAELYENEEDGGS